jgi:Papain-like cysteine protease AvrRpt2
MTHVLIDSSTTPYCLHDVTLVTQEQNKDCWHKAALTICRYRDPNFQIPEGRNADWVQQQFAADDGVTSFGDKFRMARAFGLRPIRRPSGPKLDKHVINRWLREYGPICCMMRWERVYNSVADGVKAMPVYGHCIVMTGIEDEFVHFLDPEVYNPLQVDAQTMQNEQRMTVAYFRERLSTLPRALLYKPA